MTHNNTSSNFDAVDLLIYIWKKKIPIIIFSSIAFILSIIVSFMVDERFESEVVIFPAKSGSISQDLLAQNEFKKNILEFGEDEEVEQLLQILNSDYIKGKIISKYDLMNHYEISDSEKYKQTLLSRRYKKYITYAPTKFMSIKIKVMDKDPKIAAAIANDIAALVDTVRNNMQKTRARMAFQLVEKEYRSMEKEIQHLEDSLTTIRKLGVINYESQALVLSEAYSKALLSGNTRAINTLQNKINVLAKYGGAYVSLRDYLEVQREQLGTIKAKYAEAKLDLSQNLPATFVVNPAYEAEKKSYPKRSLIVLIATFSTALLSLILMALYDSLKGRFTNLDQKK